jgi:hypothetical protein
VLFTNHYYVDEIKGVEMVRAYSTHGEIRNAYETVGGNLERKR